MTASLAAWALPSLSAAVHPERDAEAVLRKIGERHYAHGDKFGPNAKHQYHRVYAQFLAPIRFQNVTFLEIGLGCNMPRVKRRGDGIGLSVALWRAYLPNARLWWAEFDSRCVAHRQDLLTRAGVHGVVTGDQGDRTVLARWLKEIGTPIDFIIDDGGHTTAMQWSTLTGLWPGLSRGGKLVIEDMGNSRIPMYRNPQPEPGVPATMVEIVQGLLADILEFGNEAAGATNKRVIGGPSPLLQHLPGLESVHCYAEACVFIKGLQEVETS